MFTDKIAIGLVHKDLAGYSMEEARLRVRVGESKWVQGNHRTLRLVPSDYEPQGGEQFLVEAEPEKFIPETPFLELLLELLDNDATLNALPRDEVRSYLKSNGFLQDVIDAYMRTHGNG